MNRMMKVWGVAALVAATLLNTALAQEDPLIMRAMKDELKRNMSELKLDGYEKPFFMSYSITDSREVSISASLGSIIRTVDMPHRFRNVRILVGDYDFNDESLDLRGSNGGGRENDIDMPIDNDYYGIRRSLWVSSDAVYRSASKLYKDNMNYVKDQKKELKDIPHRSFAKVTPTHFKSTTLAPAVDRRKMEDLARELSIIFKSYGDITASSVFMYSSHADYYFHNSEGTEVITDDNVASVAITAQTKTAEGEVIYDHISFSSISFDKLPTVATLTNEVKQMADRLVSLRTVPQFKDTYTGPVLFVGPAAVDAFTNSLFGGGESLTSSKNINNTFAASEAKIGKKIIDERFTVKSTPKLKSYNDIPLLGSYEVDDEGVMPGDELVLVEKGTLRNLLSDRTITKEGQTSNGHGSGPGVIRVDVTNGVPAAKLKQMLIDKAKEEGLDYAIMVRYFNAGGMRSVNTYKVSLEDGKEELVRSANLKSINQKALKKILGVSDTRIVRNTETGRFGGAVSIIGPDALLFEEVEVEGGRTNPYLDRTVYVDNPLKAKK